MAEILITDITNVDGTGIFDKLMDAVNKQIETQYLNNRITGSDFANVYLSSLQAVLQQSIQFTLQQQLTEAQIADTNASIALKYTEQVLKDKQAAKLGLDNVMKQSESSKDSNPDFIYTPRYEDSI
jgi:hypothetical protein